MVSQRSRMEKITSDAILILEQLVEFETTPDKSNLPLIEWVDDYLRKMGIKCTRIFNETEDKACLWATIGDGRKPGLIMSGHSDVVRANATDWHFSPFSLTKEADRLFGRGTCDMKGFIACCLSAVPSMLDDSDMRPIHLAVSYDEEIGCLGVRRLLDYISSTRALVEGCIVGEPTGMLLAIGHKGKIAEHVSVQGQSRHSGLIPHCISSIDASAEFILSIRQLGNALELRGLRHREFQVPFTTINIAPIRGGTSVSAIAENCEFDYEIRGIPGENLEKLVKRVHAIAGKLERKWARLYPEATRITFKTHSTYPGLDTSEDVPLVREIKSILNTDQHTRLPFGTEAGLFNSKCGIPSVVLGPGFIEQAHKEDEFITVDQLSSCCSFLIKLIEHRSRAATQP